MVISGKKKGTRKLNSNFTGYNLYSLYTNAHKKSMDPGLLHPQLWVNSRTLDSFVMVVSHSKRTILKTRSWILYLIQQPHSRKSCNNTDWISAFAIHLDNIKREHLPHRQLLAFYTILSMRPVLRSRIS